MLSASNNNGTADNVLMNILKSTQKFSSMVADAANIAHSDDQPEGHNNNNNANANAEEEQPAAGKDSQQQQQPAKVNFPNEEILREALQCVACKQLVEVCCVLQCGCLMCRRCAVAAKRSQELSKLQSSMFQQQQQQQQQQPSSSSSTTSTPVMEDLRAKIVCPKCGTKTILDGPLDTIEDVLISNLAEKLRTGLALEMGQQSCGRCEKRIATKECKDCGGVAYCDRCASLQHSMGALKKHKLIDIGVGASASRAPACPSHPEEKLSLYCTQDRAPVCAHCLLLGSHLNHPRVFVADAFAQSLEKMKPRAQQVLQKEKELKEVVDKLANRLRDIRDHSHAAQADVRTKMAKLREILDEKERELVESIQKQEEERKRAVATQISGVETHLRSVQHTVAITEAAMQETDPFAWLSNSDNLESRIISTVQKPLELSIIPSANFGCKLDTTIEYQALSRLSFLGPVIQGARCSRPIVADKRAGSQSGRVVISWDPPHTAPPGKDSWTEFILETRKEGIENTEFARQYCGPLNYCEINDLPAGVNHVFRVIAVASNCSSEPSEETVFRRRPAGTATTTTANYVVPSSTSLLSSSSSSSVPTLRESGRGGQSSLPAPTSLSSRGNSTSKILDFSMSNNNDHHYYSEHQQPSQTYHHHQPQPAQTYQSTATPVAATATTPSAPSSSSSTTARSKTPGRSARNPAIMC